MKIEIGLGTAFLFFASVVILLAASGKFSSIFANTPLCNPNYISAAYALEFPTKEDYCKKICYELYKTTSFEIRINETMPYCFCDTNNCNPK